MLTIFSMPHMTNDTMPSECGGPGPAALAEPDLVRYTIRLPVWVIRHRLDTRPLRETNKFCGHAQSPLGVGACLPCSLSQTGAPSLPPNYQRSSLLWAPPTPNRHRPLPRRSGLSEGAPVASRRRRLGLLGYCVVAMSDSIRLNDPGWVSTTRQGAVDTVACWRL